MVESTRVEAAVALPESAVRPWNPVTRFAFRFLFVYFGIYVFTTQMLGGLIVLPGVEFPPLEELRQIRTMYGWAALHIFHVTQPLVVTGSGSGDKIIDWVGVFCLVVFAAAAAFVWSILDRRRPDYRSLNTWFRVFLRFALGTTMLTYGMAKAFPLQMPYPTLARLVEPYGHFSPMGVLWYSIGAAPAYERFAGSMELTAAVLLFVPALSTLGAAVAFADTVQILMLNLTYDVPVKLFAFHLLVLSLVLLAPDAKRILGVFLTRKSARPILAAVQIALAAYFVGMSYRDGRQAWAQFGPAASKPPLYGIWNVEKITVDGIDHPPLLTDTTRWRRVIIQRAASVVVQGMDDNVTLYTAQTDVAHRALSFKPPAEKSWTGKFSYEQPDPDHLKLDGEFSGHRITAELGLFATRNFLLVSRGFHWIQEYPFNQ